MEKIKSICKLVKLALQGKDFIGIPLNPADKEELEQSIKICEAMIERFNKVKNLNVVKDEKGNLYVTNMDLTSTLTSEKIKKSIGNYTVEDAGGVLV